MRSQQPHKRRLARPTGHRRALLLTTCLTVLLQVIPSQAKTCLMMYQMADNNLQYYIRQDYQELVQSPVIAKTDELRVWVYFDALNQGGGTLLPDTVDENGAEVTEDFTGSRYMKYDGTIGKMRIEQQFVPEQNSDTPDSIQAFAERAMADCLADDYNSLMMVFASHGGGFAGFGGDENARKLLSMSHRNLLASNQAIASGIREALSNTDGAPEKLEVLGFDACLMQAVGAADDYMEVADYILASEAVEPGHGWAYDAWTTAPTALGLARQVVDTFVSEKQGGSSHQTPKQLSIVDTVKFQTFIEAFDEFSGELLTLLESGDRSLHAFVSRSRASALAFEGIADAVGTKNPSALDIGSWLESFRNLCTPDSSIPFGEKLQNALDIYYEMLVVSSVGEGTSPATGMHITWPEQGEYANNEPFWNQVLFDNPTYVSEIVPNFRAFLEWFLSSGSPSDGIGETRDSICDQRAESDATGAVDRPDDDPDVLILADSASLDTDTGIFEVEATLSLDVSQMLVEYGIDLSEPFEGVLIEKGVEPTDEDYLFLLGGDVAGRYDRANYTAGWDQNFYFLNISGIGTFEALYVKDEGDGSKTIPTIFFPQENAEGLADLQYLDYLFFDFDVWKEAGGSYGFLKFSVDEADGRVNDNLALYVANSAGNLAEQPREARGLILPLVQIDAAVDGRKLSTLPGGFNQTIISWSPELDYNVLTTPARNIFDVIPSAGDVIMTMYALNNGNPEAKPDVRLYNVTISKEVATEVPAPLITEAPLPSPTDSPTPGATDPSAPTSNNPLTQAPTPTATNPGGDTPQTGAPDTSAPGNATTESPTTTSNITNTLNVTEGLETTENETESPVVEMPIEMPTTIPGNIFDHGGVTDEGMVTDDSKESTEENQTISPSSSTSASKKSGASTTGFSWLAILTTSALYNLF